MPSVHTGQSCITGANTHQAEFLLGQAFFFGGGGGLSKFPVLGDRKLGETFSADTDTRLRRLPAGGSSAQSLPDQERLGEAALHRAHLTRNGWEKQHCTELT